MSQPNRLMRGLRHLHFGPRHVRRVLPDSALSRIEQAIAQGEAAHSAEIRFVVEASLGWRRVWAKFFSRERALELFAQLHVWDTQQNNGLLLYVLLADQKVELIVDRALASVIAESAWLAVCRDLTAAYKADRYLDGTLKAIDTIHALVGPHFPPQARDPNELPDRPLVL